ncbi:MAG TPA: hypothetical protein VK438_04130 [Xanthobacteraceae bacterium]|nr:hypothetical protein [Xanthobacteraceae bacterium]
MAETHADILLFGSGNFAGRIAMDLAATAAQGVTVAIAGRNAARLKWLETAGNARAAMFDRPARFTAHRVDLSVANAAAEAIAALEPKVVVQAASFQAGNVISNQGNAWTRLVAEGGLSATAVLQAPLSVEVARAVKAVRPQAHFINCCFADVVNPLIAALGLPIACGVGNVAILSNAFAGTLARGRRLRVLAHYQNLSAWRQPAETRSGASARAWIDDREIADVYAQFARVQLTREPAIEISGASGVPLMLAMALGHDWTGHVPGPHGLPGGYPVKLRGGALDLDLPSALTRAEAISWNLGYEQESGLVVSPDGQARYTGRLRELLAAQSPALAAGFHVRDLAEATRAMTELRARLEGVSGE